MQFGNFGEEDTTAFTTGMDLSAGLLLHMAWEKDSLLPMVGAGVVCVVSFLCALWGYAKSESNSGRYPCCVKTMSQCHKL